MDLVVGPEGGRERWASTFKVVVVGGGDDVDVDVSVDEIVDMDASGSCALRVVLGA